MRARSAGIRYARALGGAALLAVVCLSTGSVRADEAALAASDPGVTTVRVERVRPRHEKRPTLRFLKQNLDFLRARMDLLRVAPGDADGRADAIDPRFLAYRRMLAEILAARDSLAVAEDARHRTELFESVTDLGRLEEQLDLMERLLAEQRVRLGLLQEDFTGRQRTALMIVLSGRPADATISSVSIGMEGGGTLSVPISSEQRESLARGGILQLSHAFVEPREQVVAIGIGGDRWPAGDSCFVTLDPARDRLSVLRLDLSGLGAAGGATALRATTWIHDAPVQASDGTESAP